MPCTLFNGSAINNCWTIHWPNMHITVIQDDDALECDAWSLQLAISGRMRNISTLKRRLYTHTHTHLHALTRGHARLIAGEVVLVAIAATEFELDTSFAAGIIAEARY